MRGDLQEIGAGTPTTLTGTMSCYRVATATPHFVPRGMLVQLTTAPGGYLTFNGSTAAWVFEAAKKLEALGRLRPGWDSYGGLSLNPDARTLTVNVLGWLASNELPTPAVVLGSEGGVHLEWRVKGRELEVELGHGQSIAFVKVHPDGQVEEGEERANLPQELRRLTWWLMHGEPSQRPASCE
jgi:hypothetical protein